MQYIKKEQPKDQSRQDRLEEQVKEIIKTVRADQDEALRRYNQLFDQNKRKKIRVSPEEIQKAYADVEPELINQMKSAAENIRAFAEKQKASLKEVRDFEVTPGVYLGHRILPIQSCCCYVPGGNYPLYSSALMLAIPAKVAGVPRVIACSPTLKGSEVIHPATLVAMDLAGVDEIYAVGGAQAIAACAYGTEEIRGVDLIVGPGNQYVTEAKRQCYGQVGIDFIAGPSEVLIIAEKGANPEYIAADLLAQSEHDLQAKGILVTTDEELGYSVLEAIKRQLVGLETAQTATIAWENNGEVILVKDLEEAYEWANDLAPEHLEVHVQDEEAAKEKLVNYGSLFVGENAAEVFGDYVSGTNHTLPTLKAARYTGGVYVGTYLKTCTYQKMTKEGVKHIGETAYQLALGEGLYAHAYAAKVRVDKKTKL